jgi:hypothetical protein
MSELIDRIFDVEKISKDVADILSKLSEITEATNVYKNAVVGLESTIRKSKGYEDLAKSTKSLNDNVIAGGVEMKRYESEVEKLRQKTEQLTGAEKAASIEIAKARLELQAAQKATKEAAIAEIELTAKNKDLTGSYNALQKDLQNSIKAFKALSAEETKSAKGQELLKKIGETQTALKKSDAAMGNYQRNVGNYASALEGLTPRIGGLAGTLLDIAKSATKSRDELNEMGGDNGLGIMAKPRIPAGLATIMTGIGGITKSAIAMGKAFFANPIGVVILAVVGAFKILTELFGKFDPIIDRIQQGLAALKAIFGSLKDTVLSVITGQKSLTEAVIGSGKAMSDAAKAAIEMKKAQQELDDMNWIATVNQEKYKNQVNELILQSKNRTIAEKDRIKMIDEALRIEEKAYREKKAIADQEVKIAQLAIISNHNLTAAQIGNLKKKGVEYAISLKDIKAVTDAEVKALADALAKQYQATGESIALREKAMNRRDQLADAEAAKEAKMSDEAKAAREKREAEQIASAEKIIAARRRLIDSQFALMVDSEEKSLSVSAEAFKRKIEDLKRNGELTKELLKNLTTIQENEQNSIRGEWGKKRIEESKKTNDELLAIELKRIEGIQKGIQNQTDLLSTEYKRRETFLKKEFANGLLTEKKYQEELTILQLEGITDVNNQQIAALKKLLLDSELTTDKRAELSAKLAQIEIDNDNAIVDATIQANDDKLKSDEKTIAKRIAVAQALGDATMQIFGAISDYAKEKSEQRISELEKELEVSNTAFDEEQQNLDNSLMSDESRAAKQIEIDNKKAAAEKVINDKIQAEKIKQAKWDKANAIVQAIISAGLAVLNASQTKPFIPLGLIAAGLATTLGAIQIATIASQPIPAYEKGTDNHPGGLSLWGEKRAEVAVTPSGQAFLAEKPTISNFDAGTKIFKSVSDYENFIAKQSVNQMTFDYDKFGEKMPQNNIILDGSGLWSIVNKQNARRKLINRRYSS